MTIGCAWTIGIISWWLTLGFISNQWQKQLWFKEFGDLESKPHWCFHLLWGPGALIATFLCR